ARRAHLRQVAAGSGYVHLPSFRFPRRGRDPPAGHADPRRGPGARANLPGASLCFDGDPARRLHRPGHPAKSGRHALRQGAVMRQDLFAAAVEVRDRAHAPYSGYPVGAALLTETGDVYVGCNVENAALPAGWCAETSAIAHMVTAARPGPGRKIREVCVVADRIDQRLVTPCGGCRQRLAEFGGADTLVHASDPDGKSRTFRLAELLPAAFALEGDQ